ncbi:Nucleotide modification associated domain-containing protein [Pseudomonas sp. P14-2025]
MPMSPKVFSYKLVRDYGFAPNPFHGVCTLGTCKPQIRKGARVGDIIIGCGSKALALEGKIIFAMRVSQKMTFQEYWDHDAFKIKRPNLRASKSMAYGDNIYRRHGDDWIQEDSHHSLPEGRLNRNNLARDTGSDNVLIGEDFVYWGASAIEIPEHLRNFKGDDLYPHFRNYRNGFSKDFRAEIDAWFQGLKDRGRRGRPASWN